MTFINLKGVSALLFLVLLLGNVKCVLLCFTEQCSVYSKNTVEPLSAFQIMCYHIVTFYLSSHHFTITTANTFIYHASLCGGKSPNVEEKSGVCVNNCVVQANPHI